MFSIRFILTLLCITSVGVISLSLLNQIIGSPIYIELGAIILGVSILLFYTSYPIYLINSTNKKYINIKIQNNYLTTTVSCTIIRDITVTEYGEKYQGKSHKHVTDTYVGYPIIISCQFVSVSNKITPKIKRIKRVAIIDSPIYHLFINDR